MCLFICDYYVLCFAVKAGSYVEFHKFTNTQIYWLKHLTR